MPMDGIELMRQLLLANTGKTHQLGGAMTRDWVDLVIGIGILQPSSQGRQFGGSSSGRHSSNSRAEAAGCNDDQWSLHLSLIGWLVKKGKSTKRRSKIVRISSQTLRNSQLQVTDMRCVLFFNSHFFHCFSSTASSTL